jgi:hypothetical protein
MFAATGGSTGFTESRRFRSPDLTTLDSSGGQVALGHGAPGTFDFAGIWAPHVIEHQGQYYMYYAGIDTPHSAATTQRIGLATSTGLDSSFGPGRRATPMYECEAPWTLMNLQQPQCYHNYCRDPFVIHAEQPVDCKDDTGQWRQARWLMFTTARLNPNWGPQYDPQYPQCGTECNSQCQAAYCSSEGIVVACAEQPDGPWYDLGYIEATRQLKSNQGGRDGQLPCNAPNTCGTCSGLPASAAENPFVTEFDGVYYLFFKDNTDLLQCDTKSIIQYARSSTLDADPNGSLNWEYMGYIPDAWLNAPEIIVHEGDTWIMSGSYWGCCSLSGPCAPSTPCNLDCQCREALCQGQGHDIKEFLVLQRMVWNPDGTFDLKNLTNPDCRVSSDSINPGSVEVCDGIDNDCDMSTDNLFEICNDTIDNDCDQAIDCGLRRLRL